MNIHSCTQNLARRDETNMVPKEHHMVQPECSKSKRQVTDKVQHNNRVGIDKCYRRSERHDVYT